MRQKSVSDLARDWWVMGLRGLAAMVACVIILVTSFPYAENILRVFGGYLFIDGLIVLILAAFEARRRKGWAKAALNGLLGVIFGITNLIGSGPLRFRADLIAARTFLAGISNIITARQLRIPPSEWLLSWLLVMAGFGSVIFSLMLSVGPLLVGQLPHEFGWVGALYTLGLGILFLTISFWLLKLHRKPASTAAA